nr:TAXI family TRAP transporter solute-binding subunit [Amycolatopsis suaedae]
MLLAAAGCLLTACGGTGYDGPVRRLAIASGERGGFYLAFAEQLAAVLNRVEPNLRAVAVPTQASVDNLRLLGTGEADLALTLADSAESATRGEPPFAQPAGLRALGRVYENYLQLVVRADGPVRDLAGLAGRTVSLGAAGSGSAVFGTRMLAAAGLSVRAEYLTLSAAVDGLRERRIDAFLWSGGVPTPAVAELAAGTAVRLVPLDGVLPALRAAYGPVYEQVRVPAGAYLGVGDLPTVGTPNLLVSAPSLPDDVAGAITRVLAGHATELVPEQAVGAQFLDVRTLIGTGRVPLHPGAAAAYRELHG